MHSWMPTMPKYVFVLPKVTSILRVGGCCFLIRIFNLFADGHQLEDIQKIVAAVCFLYFM